MTGSWTEIGLTWNNMPNYTTTYTATEGCVEGSWCNWDVTDIIQLWLRSDSPGTNHGLQVDTIGKGSTYWKRFIASEQGRLEPTEADGHLPPTRRDEHDQPFGLHK